MDLDFSGRRFWEFEDHALVTNFPEEGLPLTDLGIDELVDRIDAAAVGLGSLNRRVYLFSGYEYWRLRHDRRMTVDRGYPLEISDVFRGVPPNVDAAFTNVDGNYTNMFLRSEIIYDTDAFMSITLVREVRDSIFHWLGPGTHLKIYVHAGI